MGIRLKFIWPDKTRLKDRKRLGLVSLRRSMLAQNDRLDISINTRAALILLAVLAVVGWLAGAGGFTWWENRDPYNRITFLDVVWPPRWTQLRDLRGQAQIARAADEIKNKQIGPGLFDLKAGLKSHPQDMGARLLLAQTFARSGYYTGAREAMLEAFDRPGVPRPMVDTFFGWAISVDDWSGVAQACDLLLAHAGPATDRDSLLRQKAGVLFKMERPADVLECLGQLANPGAVEARELRVRALCALGRAAEAVTLVDSWPPETGGLDLWRQQMRLQALREAGRLDEVRSALQKVEALEINARAQRLTVLACELRCGWRDSAWNELQEYLRRYDSVQGGLLDVGNVCTEAGAPELLAVCLERAQELGTATPTMAYHLAIERARAGDLAAARQAVQTARELAAAPPHSVADGLRRPSSGLLGPAANLRLEAPVPSGATTVANDTVSTWTDALLDSAAGTTSGGPARLLAALTTRGIGLNAYRDSLAVLGRAEKWAVVQQVADTGLASFSYCWPLAQWQKKAREHLASAPEPVAAAAPVRAPVRSPAKAAGPADPATADHPVREDVATLTAAQLFTRLDDAKSHQDFSRQQRLIDAVRQAAPSWAPEVEPELAWREVDLALDQDEVPRALRLAELRLRVRESEAIRALAFARALATRGQPDAARRMAKAIVTVWPAYGAGQDFYRQLPPATAPAGGATPGAKPPAATPDARPRP